MTKPTMKELEDIFGPVISSYTDTEAVDDGVLVAVNTKDRVTRTVFEFLAADGVLDPHDPPNRWPIDLIGYIRAKDGDGRALAAVRGLIGTHANEASKVYDREGIWTAKLKVKDGKAESLVNGFPDPKEADGDPNTLTLWLIPNENGGVTLMFPEDN